MRHRKPQTRGRALVTGGAVRLGRAIAVGLADAGFDVVIGYHRSAAAARATVRDLRGRGVRALAVRADLREPAAGRRLVNTAARAHGGLDVLVNNAAAFARTPLARATLADWNAQVDVNLRAPFLCIQAAAPLMRRGGRIVNVADAWSRGAPSGWSAYAASKAGLEALTRVLAVELRPRRIAVNGIAPGPVLKPTHLPPARWRAITRGRTARVADVVAAVVRFAKGSPTVTGQVREIRSRRRRAGR